jgi:hypothetical protein
MPLLRRLLDLAIRVACWWIQRDTEVRAQGAAENAIVAGALKHADAEEDRARDARLAAGRAAARDPDGILLTDDGFRRD